jgi:cystathionine beta-lyase
VQPSSSEFGAYDYTRSGNPTRTALEKHAAMLEKAAAAFAFASGMAALHTMLRLLKNGDEIIVNEDIYGGMHRILTQDCVHNGIRVVFGDTTDLASIERLITPQTRMIHTESPSNPRMRISDLRRLAEIAHRHGVLLSVDSTMMPPVICKPLDLGVDIVVHSATKFFSGHADCTGGLVCVRDPQVAHRIAFLQNAEGTALAPFECFLFLRGMKTMHLRVMKAQENAEHVAAFLMNHPHVKDVFFPGKGGCSSVSLAIHKAQALGQGSMISLTTGSIELSKRVCDACQIFKTTVSFGSVNSLCEMPCTMSHASIPAEERSLPADLVRLSIGIEDYRDLIADLTQAFDLAASQEKPPLSPQLKNDRGYDSKFDDLPVLPRLPSTNGLHSLANGTDKRTNQKPVNTPPKLINELPPKNVCVIPSKAVAAPPQPKATTRLQHKKAIDAAVFSAGAVVGALAAGTIVAIALRRRGH